MSREAGSRSAERAGGGTEGRRVWNEAETAGCDAETTADIPRGRRLSRPPLSAGADLDYRVGAFERRRADHQGREQDGDQDDGPGRAGQGRGPARWARTMNQCGGPGRWTGRGGQGRGAGRGSGVRVFRSALLPGSI